MKVSAQLLPGWLDRPGRPFPRAGVFFVCYTSRMSAQNLPFETAVEFEDRSCSSCGAVKRQVPTGESLRRFRTSWGVSGPELARKIVNPDSGKNLHISFLSNIENGRSPAPPWVTEGYRRWVPELPKAKALPRGRLDPVLSVKLQALLAEQPRTLPELAQAVRGDFPRSWNAGTVENHVLAALIRMRDEKLVSGEAKTSGTALWRVRR